MEEAQGIVEALSKVGWAAATAIVVLFALAVTAHAWRTAQERREQLAARRDWHRRKLAKYRAALASGDAEKAMLAKRALDAARKGLPLAAIIIASLCAAGCHQKPPKNNAIPIGRYVQAPAPGDAVPPLPEGEQRWWLLSAPTGFELLMPEGASAPEGGE